MVRFGGSFCPVCWEPRKLRNSRRQGCSGKKYKRKGLSLMVDSAADMARQYGLNPEKFRDALRKEKFPWHRHCARWNPPDDSAEYQDMVRVAKRLAAQ